MDRTEYFYHSQRNHFPEESQASDSVYTERIEDVIASEQAYLKARRQRYGETRPGDQGDQLQDIWGLAISGGGIRSATLGLGMLQRFLEKHLLQKFDYLSTVSGGGYIGSCFSTLMNTHPDQFVQPKSTQIAAQQGKEHQIPGLTPATSPFMLLMEEQEETALATSALPANEPIAEVINGEEGKPELVTDPANSRSFVPGVFEVEGDTDEQGLKKPATQQMDLTYKTVKETRLDARHQMHHLRTHGEYLTPEKRFFSPDMQRAIGTFLAGIVHNLLLFILALTVLVSAHYVLFEQVSGGEFFPLMYDTFDPAKPDLAFADLTPDQQAGLNDNWLDRFGVYVSLILEKTTENGWFILGFLFTGLLLGLWFIRKSQQLSQKILAEEAAIRSKEKESSSRSGQDIQAYFERGFLLTFNQWSIAGPLVLLVVVYAVAHWLDLLQPDAYWVIFSWPFFAGLGIFLGVYVPTALIGYPDDQPRVARALLGGLRGAAFYALLLSLLVPIGLLLLFSADRLLDGLVSGVSSVASIGVGYLVAATQSQAGDQDSITSKLMRQVKTPLLSISVVLFVLLSAVAILNGIHAGYGMLEEARIETPLALWVMLGAFCLFLLLGYFVDANKLSLHYFYRDRLSEAYLRTDGRSRRGEGMDRQGMPLINLRDDENLRLKDLGWELLSKEEAQTVKAHPDAHPDCRQDADGQVWRVNARGPYHIIVTALNLQGSEELVRKDLRSDHFIFSRNYVGSQSTGYVKTGVYRDGKTKLARAMTISAAAVSSGMGFSSFFAQSFLTTVLNLRLGYWMENPWFYRYLEQGRLVHSPKKYRQLKREGWQDFLQPDKKPSGKDGYRVFFNPKRRHTFWPMYLFMEMLGFNTADSRLVNVSDGGHTGDNLGLLPLLQRKCRVIVVGDFEQDNSFTFESFNHAVRMANIEESIEIQIDLRPLVPKDSTPQRIGTSQQSVVKGKIIYADGSTGILYYLKSSVSMPDIGAKSSQGLPINVYNYYKKHPDFPHQSTADQYFDDAQFEAYRRLGFYLAREATELMQHQLKQEEC